MNENSIVFEEFPGKKIKKENKNSFINKHSNILFTIVLSIMILLLFFISSIANKNFLDSKEDSYYEKM